MEAEKISFIDYDFVYYNYRGYDLANFFCQFMGFTVDVTKFPNRDQQRRCINSYIFHKLSRDPTEKETQEFYKQINRLSLICHIFWGVLAVMKSKISSFNLKEFSRRRFHLFFTNKDSFLRNDGSSEYKYHD